MVRTVKVVVTVAMQGVFTRLEPEFAKATAHGIALDFAPPSAAAQRIRDGEATDIVISTPDAIDGLIGEGILVAGSNRVVARMIMGIAVGLDQPKPDIGTADQFKQALLGAKSIIHADPSTGSPSAAHFLKVIGQLGITEEIKRKTTMRAGVVAHAVASGECAMAVQQLAELMLVDGIHVLGPFPAELQNVMPLSAAVHAQSRHAETAQTLIGLLASPGTRRLVEQCGLLAAVD
jgi:molybdate transport system substrate-binding protein